MEGETAPAPEQAQQPEQPAAETTAKVSRERDEEPLWKRELLCNKYRKKMLDTVKKASVDEGEELDHSTLFLYPLQDDRWSTTLMLVFEDELLEKQTMDTTRLRAYVRANQDKLFGKGSPMTSAKILGMMGLRRTSKAVSHVFLAKVSIEDYWKEKTKDGTLGVTAENNNTENDKLTFTDLVHIPDPLQFSDNRLFMIACFGLDRGRSFPLTPDEKNQLYGDHMRDAQRELEKQIESSLTPGSHLRTVAERDPLSFGYVAGLLSTGWSKDSDLKFYSDKVKEWYSFNAK